VYVKLAEAEALTEAKQAKKKGKKAVVGESISIVEAEGLQVAM
jgi:hypothetical protein